MGGYQVGSFMPNMRDENSNSVTSCNSLSNNDLLSFLHCINLLVTVTQAIHGVPIGIGIKDSLCTLKSV